MQYEISVLYLEVGLLNVVKQLISFVRELCRHRLLLVHGFIDVVLCLIIIVALVFGQVSLLKPASENLITCDILCILSYSRPESCLLVIFI